MSISHLSETDSKCCFVDDETGYELRLNPNVDSRLQIQIYYLLHPQDKDKLLVTASDWDDYQLIVPAVGGINPRL
ncbi:MAG: hypothetical protein WCG83_07365 [Candidatus Peregrinibacteria bacterium]